MAFEEIKDNIDQIQDEAKAYIESSIIYYKLWGFKVAMKSTIVVFKFVLIGVCSLMALLFGSVAAALAIGSALQSNILGFLIVAGAYALLTSLLFLINHRIIEGTVLRKFSEIFFND